MKVREVRFDIRLPQSHGRSKGRHLSEVMRSLAFLSGVLDTKYDVEEMDETLMGMGMAFEDWLVRTQHPEVIGQPGELEMDGIFMTPDGMSLLDGDVSRFGIEENTDPKELDPWVLHEMKFTKKSSRDFVEHLRMQTAKAQMYLWQIKAYCLALGTRLAQLHILFVNGNYARDDSPESKSTYRVYCFQFTDEELHENWNMILSHAKEMTDAGR